MTTKKTLTVVGARPQFVKAAMVSRAIKTHNDSAPTLRLNEEILHTGQHYDQNMSDIFFTEMGIPEPAVNLAVGSGRHGETTGAMLAGIETEILARKPDLILVYGDTNSTLAAALAAAKLHVPVAHVEAGLRSFNRQMPEEINRVLTDHLAALLFCPTQQAVEHLASEGITVGVSQVGDVMYDAALLFAKIADEKSTILSDLDLASQSYFLATVHRAENTDEVEILTEILQGLSDLAQDQTIIFPCHPRTRACIERCGLTEIAAKLRMIEPVSFLDMIALEKQARLILTDSGGVQKEACFHSVPCVTLRNETEWVETVSAGWNTLVGHDRVAIVNAARTATPGTAIDAYGQGESAGEIVNSIAAWLEKDN